MKRSTPFKIIAVLGLFLLFSGLCQGQILVRAVVVDGDTLPSVRLKTVYITGQLSSKKRRVILQNNRKLIYNVKKVMPYAQACASSLRDINANLANLETKREKNKYLKSAERDLKAKYEGKLKKLSSSQGKLLVKLVGRQCGSNSYELIKLMKSGRSAFLWNGVAGLFGISLKDDYDREQEQELEVVLKYLGY